MSSFQTVFLIHPTMNTTEATNVQSGPQIEQDLLTTKHASSDRIQRESSPHRGRSSTDPARPITPIAKPNKRIIICCDGYTPLIVSFTLGFTVPPQNMARWALRFAAVEIYEYHCR